MNRFFTCTSAVLLTALLSAPLLAADDPADHPGYVALDALPFVDGQQPNVEVTLQGPVLKMLLQFPAMHDESGQVKELLKVVDHILVRIYTMSQDQAQDTLTYIGETSAALEQQNWQRIVRVRETDDSNVDIHVKVSEDGENLNGLVIMAVENKRGDDAEVVFVNIAGNFNPAYLANIGDQFDIDHLDGLQLP